MSNLLVLAAAILYAAAALLIKRAAELGAGALRTLFVSNLICAVIFQPLWLLEGTIHWDLWWQPVAVSLCFIGGQGFTFLSLQRGDVSVATPVLGIKILLVALLVTLLAGETLRPSLWAAAVLATCGIGLLSRRPAKHHHHVGSTVLTASLGALCFALFDVFMQEWASNWGLGRFLPLTFGIAGLMSLPLLSSWQPIPAETKRAAWLWLLAGAIGIGAQSLLIVITIAHWGQAAQANVMYSSRGLWSIALVWLAGHLVQSQEHQLGGRILAWRFAGAVLMTLAILFVLI